jgi:hypothetical protein
MVTKTIKNGIFYTSINIGSKTPFKDIEDDFDIAAANEKIIKDAVAHIEDIIMFVESLRITKTQTEKINFDTLLPESKLRELGYLK